MEAYEGMATPWGIAQTVGKVAEGIWFVTTASHGGYVLDAERNAVVPMAVRLASFQGQGVLGYYEEDCDWRHVVRAFPEHFDRDVVVAADGTHSAMALAGQR